MKFLKVLSVGILAVVAAAGLIMFVGESVAQDETGQLYRKDKNGDFVPLVEKIDEDTEPEKIEVKEAAAGDRFHILLIRGAIKAKRAGKITGKQLRRLRVAMLAPAFREKAKELAAIQMFSKDPDSVPKLEREFGDNLADIIAAIDWDKLADFIERLVPLIIKLIEAIVAVA